MHIQKGNVMVQMKTWECKKQDDCNFNQRTIKKFLHETYTISQGTVPL